ncbi:MAG: LL-diaminopimelate aminotransferase [Nanoarchaeota archaeon]|nr:LL-diaminopimelate aminotransferase [Nanoarchaeota archaeon]
MANSNPAYKNLPGGYLFPELAKRTRAFSEKHPGVKIMRLGIGNTTEPLPSSIIKGLGVGVKKLASVETYTGYGDEQGNTELRKKIAEVKYKKAVEKIEADEIFVSDGAKSDTANIQELFSKESIIAIQDPAYPVYVDSNVMAGRTGKIRENGQYEGIVYMPCTEKNGFFPEIPQEKVDIIYICSPNNPTGAVATKEQLKKFVDYAIKNKIVIIFDSAYERFIYDSSLPRSIYEIPGAKRCAIEINSFSKEAGFTGVRLGWTVVPKTLMTEDGANLNSLWNRRQCTKFNGASNIAQEGGIAALDKKGLKETQKVIDLYMKNASVIKKGLESIGIKCYGGVNAPYIWMKCPNQMSSWDFFSKLLEEANVVCTPGSGFGPSGEGFVRLSAFGHPKDIKKAIESIKKNLKI